MSETLLSCPKAHVKQALEKTFKSIVILKQCVIERITQCGENFCSDIYRVHVRFQCEDKPEIMEKHLILKILLPQLANLGSNESYMYEEVLPAMEQLLLGNGDNIIKLKANCLLTDNNDKEVYVLEDLTALGYQSGDRFIGLDEQHTRIALEKIAKFHAASMIVATNHSDLIARLNRSHFANGADDPLANAICHGGMEYAAQVVAEWQGFEEIAEKMLKNIPISNERMRNIADHKNRNLNVIVHGDLWVNNMLFSYNADGVPKDAMFIDFQNCYLGSPAIDLQYFLFTSVQLNVLQTKRYELLRYYFNILTTTLKLCGHEEIPTWQMLLDELLYCEFYGYYSVVCELPICCMTKEVSAGFTVDTFTDAINMPKKRILMYDNKRVQDTLRYALDRLNELRIFD